MRPSAFRASSLKLWIPREIRFTPHSELYARANDPLLLFRELSSLGAVEVKARRTLDAMVRVSQAEATA